LPVGFTLPLLTFSHSVARCANVLAQWPVPCNCRNQAFYAHLPGDGHSGAVDLRVSREQAFAQACALPSAFVPHLECNQDFLSGLATSVTLRPRWSGVLLEGGNSRDAEANDVATGQKPPGTPENHHFQSASSFGAESTPGLMLQRIKDLISN